MSALLNLAQVAARLGVSKTTAWRLVEAGELPAIRITATIKRVAEADLEEWIASRRQRGPSAEVVPLRDRAEVAPP